MDFKKRKITYSSLHDILLETNIRIEDIHSFLDRDKSSINEDRCGKIPLMAVLETGNCSVNILKILLQYGANVNFKDRLGCSPLFYALKCNSDVSLIKALLEAPGFSSINEVDRNGISPLSFAVKYNCSPDIVKILLQYGANVNFQDTLGHSPLYYALKCKRDETLIRALLEAPDFCSINVADQFHNTPLLFAVKYNCSSNSVKLILQYGANVNCQDTLGHSPLYYALTCNNDETVIRALVEAPGFCSINVANEFNNTPLLLAIRNNCSSNIVKLLLQYGADVTCKSTNGCSILINALECNCDETVIKVLLEVLDVTSVNEVHPRYGFTPLYFALIWREKCSVNIIKLLLQYGADVSFRKVDCGATILRAALSCARNKATVKLLIKYSYLKIENFDIGPLLNRRRNLFEEAAGLGPLLDYEEEASFAEKCAQEVQKMVSVEVSRGRTLREVVSEYSPPQGSVTLHNTELKNILSQLLKMRIDIVCPIYFDMILVKVGKQEMIRELQEVILQFVRNFNSVSSLGKVLLSYGCACEVARHLQDDELFKLILTFCVTGD